MTEAELAHLERMLEIPVELVTLPAETLRRLLDELRKIRGEG